MSLRLSFLTAVACIGIATFAQTTVTTSSFGFSNGVHPTFSFIFEGTDVKYVESYWRDELKKISHDVSNKKEVIGAGALVPQVSPDTVRVLVKAEQRKGSPLLTAHVAILTTAGYVGPTSEAAVLDAAKSFVQMHSTAIRRQLAQQELSEAEKGLSRLRSELANLVREKERAEAGIEKSKQRAAEAAQEQERTKAQLADLVPRIEAQRTEVASAPSEEATKTLNDLLKEQSKATDKNRRALDDERNMNKKADDLAWEIKQNVDDQAVKSTSIAQQETLVKALRDKLTEIR
jgi:hypothetical protein